MNKFLQIFCTAFIILYANLAKAQNCTINAGADRAICPGLPFELNGTATGNFASGAVWTQISGPAVTVSTTTVSAGVAKATVTGYAQNVEYTFRLSAKCTDGSPVVDDAKYIASNLTVANAGQDINQCPGVLTMAANAVKPGETGTWSVVSGNLPVPSPQTSPTATVNLPATGNTVGVTVFRWTITNGSCSTTSDIKVTNLGAISPVTASSPVNVSCYTVTGSVQLNASYGGAGNGQQGTWSFISGPSIPSFNNVNRNDATISNLVEGTYVVRWTVVGPCASGFKDVTINVGPPTQSVTTAGNPTLTYCDGRTSTTLEGAKPQYTGETVQWTAAATNPTAVTIHSPNVPTTSISGLNGTGNYNFTYTITNAFGCTSTGTYRIRYTAAPSVNIGLTSPQILPCGITQVSIPYTVGGGNTTQWALVSSPAGSDIETLSGLNNFTTAANSPQIITGLNKPGTYIIRFRRYSDNSSGGCNDAFADISIIVSKTPYQANAGTAQLLACSTVTATLAGNDPAAGDAGRGEWSQVSGPNKATIANKLSSTTGISNLVSGVYVFRWIVSGGENDCGDTQSDTRVIVASNPTIVNAGADIGTCYGTPVKLSANQPQLNETGTWSVVSESPASPASILAFSNINDPNAVVIGLLANKTYHLEWKISNSCGTITDNVTINTTNSNGPKQAVAGADQCKTSGTTSFTLAGNTPAGAETGTWTLIAGAPNTPTFNAGVYNTTVSGAVNGTYKFEWRLENGSCNPTRDTVTITISGPTTVATITGAPTVNVCSLTDINLQGNTPAAAETGYWTQTAGPGGAVIADPNSAATTVSGLTPGRYKFKWTISNGACSSSSAEITYNISEPPTTSVAGSDQVLCDATSVSLAANSPTVGTGLWSVVSGPNNPTFSSLNNSAATVSNLDLGVYIFKWTITNGSICAPSSSTVKITVGKSANAGADQNLCNTTTTLLQGNEGSMGNWSYVSGPAHTLSQNPNTSYAVLSDLIPGSSYVFRYTITSGGCGTVTDDVTINVSGPPSTADAGTDQDLCTANGTSVSIAATAPLIGTGAWSIRSQPTGGTAVITSTSSASTTVTGLTKAGVYILEWTVSNANCSGTQSNKDVLRITVSNPPTTVQPMAAQTSACTDRVVLTGTTPLIGNGTWTYVSGGTSTPVITAPNSPTTTVTNLNAAPGNPYIFKWEIKSGSCTPSSQTVSVNVTDVTPSAANAGSDQTTCTNAIGGTGSVTLAANAAVGSELGTWTVASKPVSSSPAFANPTVASTSISNLKAGVYVLKWTLANGSSCTNEDEVTITAFDPPSTADAGPVSATYCLYAPVQLNATAPVSGVGTWSVITKPAGASDPVFSNVNAANASVNGLIQGAYQLRWTTSNGPCTTSQDDITVNIEDCQIAVSKTAGTPVQQNDGSYNVTFSFKVKNSGSTALSNVQVEDDLALTFPSPKTFTKVNINATGSLVANANFNGAADKNLLTAASSTLPANAEGTITLTVNVKLN
ncbi:PKD domain-containing protein [Desertivirga brevis]|uniref:PKD domain-containing protein n=1 Tax=Desertivirga brevis TaxID=2810310 RepID=UPI001A97A59C|nr:hypothetical protein [Pedobacter sp. SYSU D00873]